MPALLIRTSTRPNWARTPAAASTVEELWLTSTLWKTATPPAAVIACTVSGALLGVGGAPMPMYLSFIEPTSSFNLSYAVSALAMPIIGGIGHWAGPVIGALLLGTLQQVVTVTISNELNVLVVGVLLVVFVVIAPDGILGWVKSWKRSSK